jgi:hypothetical protein
VGSTADSTVGSLVERALVAMFQVVLLSWLVGGVCVGEPGMVDFQAAHRLQILGLDLRHGMIS